MRRCGDAAMQYCAEIVADGGKSSAAHCDGSTGAIRSTRLRQFSRVVVGWRLSLPAGCAWRCENPARLAASPILAFGDSAHFMKNRLCLRTRAAGRRHSGAKLGRAIAAGIPASLRLSAPKASSCQSGPVPSAPKASPCQSGCSLSVPKVPPRSASAGLSVPKGPSGSGKAALPVPKMASLSGKVRLAVTFYSETPSVWLSASAHGGGGQK